MFELSVARKYLTPRWRQLSVSIISLISILVIALVVWLIVVFFSVTNGLEKGWVNKLIALTSPIRVTPTEAYYNSYYYLVDGISANSDYATKSIHEKLSADNSSSYDPSSDEEAPKYWSKPDLDSNGQLKDLVKEAYNAIQNAGSSPRPYEVTTSNLRLRLIRNKSEPAGHKETQAFLSQPILLGSLDPKNQAMEQTLIPVSVNDLNNLYTMLSVGPEQNTEEAPDFIAQTSVKLLREKRSAFLKTVAIKEPVQGESPSKKITITKAEVKKDASPLWVHTDANHEYILPYDAEFGDGILVPKAFREAGVLVGDRGYISYYAPTTSSVQEQRLPIYVAGFYDSGIIPIGGKLVIANSQLVSLIRSSHQQEETANTNGINVRFDDLNQADSIKEKIQAGFKAAGVDKYWRAETYKEYEFTKDLLQQLKSDKTLFTLISTIIIIVACSNIISMLIILVNDKKVEIGILRSMGASCWSIAAIFGTCGVVMGVLGSLTGTVAAVITLNNIDLLISFLSKIQGHNAFNPVFYGETLPNEISVEALLFVIMSTAMISLVAGVVPAIKASLLRPSAILRSE